MENPQETIEGESMKQTFRFDSATALVQTTAGLVRGYGQNGLNIFKGTP